MSKASESRHVYTRDALLNLQNSRPTDPATAAQIPLDLRNIETPISRAEISFRQLIEAERQVVAEKGAAKGRAFSF